MSMNPNVSLDSGGSDVSVMMSVETLGSSLVTDGPLRWGSWWGDCGAGGGWYIGTLCSVLLVSLKALKK